MALERAERRRRHLVAGGVSGVLALTIATVVLWPDTNLWRDQPLSTGLIPESAGSEWGETGSTSTWLPEAGQSTPATAPTTTATATSPGAIPVLPTAAPTGPVRGTTYPLAPTTTAPSPTSTKPNGQPVPPKPTNTNKPPKPAPPAAS